MDKSRISHLGQVVKKERNKLKIKIISVAACDLCHAKSSCNMAETVEKIIEADQPENQVFSPGDRVEVSIGERTGYFAVLIAFLVPVILMILLLVTGMVLKWPELMTGMVALSGTVLYFPVLYLLRSKISKKIHFQIRRINE